MRTWLYDHLTSYEPLQAFLGGTLESAQERIFPRESQSSIPVSAPFLMFGLGNETNEDLAEDVDHCASRQFFQIWVHDRAGSYTTIDDIIPVVKNRLIMASHPPSLVSQVRYLETSAEFSNETYNTIFRYIRFQAIISKGKATP